MSAAIAAAGNAGILVVAAAGNSGTSNDASPQYPANYGSGSNADANVLSVAASNSSDQLASFSNYGANTVDLAAPGVSIYSTYLGAYATMSGTSMAAPEVTGVAALCWAVDPNATVAQVKAAILQGVDKIAGLAGKVATGGRLDAYNALRLIQADVVPTPAPTPAPKPTPTVGGLSVSPAAVQPGATVTLVASGVAESGGAVASVSFYLDSDGSAAWDSSDRLIGTTSNISGGVASLSFNTTGMAAGNCRFFARALDAAGV